MRELREIDVGDWQGRAEIKKRFQALKAWRRGENGLERRRDVRRARPLAAALERIAREHPQGAVLVVGHGGRSARYVLISHEVTVAEHRRALPAIANTKVFRIDVQGDGFRPVD